jgi:hypothetical protein
MNNVNVPKQPTGTNHFQFRIHQLGLGVRGTVGFCSTESFYFSHEALCNHSFKAIQTTDQFLRLACCTLHASAAATAAGRCSGHADPDYRPAILGNRCCLEQLAAFKLGPLALFCRPYARSERSSRFAHRLPHRAPQFGNCSVGKPAPTRGSRIRSYRMCDVFRLRPLQTPCHIHSRKLRM